MLWNPSVSVSMCYYDIVFHRWTWYDWQSYQHPRVAITNCCEFFLHGYIPVSCIHHWQCILHAFCFAQKSVVEVEWTAIHKKNIYRRGHGGKVNTATNCSWVLLLSVCALIHCCIQVDLKCTVSGSSFGGYYYPDHLLVLGQFQWACTTSCM